MRIDKRQDCDDRQARLRDDIERARRLGPLPEPVCTPACEQYDAGIGCRRSCAAAAQRLSSDPARFPIEPAIVPLVFELKRLGVFHPCWSCEGHHAPDGGLWKWPEVWFYADSVVHVRALAEAIAGLRLSRPWQVVVVHSDPGNPDTTFALRPRPDDGSADLASLRADVETLAAALPDRFRDACLALARRATGV